MFMYQLLGWLVLQLFNIINVPFSWVGGRGGGHCFYLVKENMSLSKERGNVFNLGPVATLIC